MATRDIRPFLRLQTNAWLTALRDKLATDITNNVVYTSLSFAGKAVGQQEAMNTIALAQQLADVLVERGQEGSDYKAKDRMTVARFA